MERLLTIVLFFVYTLQVDAEDKVLFSGFGTIASVSVDSDNYGYRKDLEQKGGVFDTGLDFSSMSTLGGQIDYIANSEFSLVYQAVYRNQNSFSIDSATTLAFLKYTPSADWSYRFGRTALDLFLLTEYRDVSFAYSWAHAPNEVYSLVPYRSLDGADISYTTRFKDLTFHSKLFFGQSQSDLVFNETVEDIYIDNIFGLNFELESINWNINSKLTSAKIDEKLHSSTNQLINALFISSKAIPNFNFIWPDSHLLIDKLRQNNKQVNYASIGTRYSFQQWSIIGEFSFIRSNSDVISDINSGYVSVIYQTDEQSFYGVYAKVRADNFRISELGVNNDAIKQIPGLEELYNAVDITLNGFTPNQTTLSLGWRWDISENTALNIQWDRTDIDENGSTLWLNRNSFVKPAEVVYSFFTSLSFTF